MRRCRSGTARGSPRSDGWFLRSAGEATLLREWRQAAIRTTPARSPELPIGSGRRSRSLALFHTKSQADLRTPANATISRRTPPLHPPSPSHAPLATPSLRTENGASWRCLEIGRFPSCLRRSSPPLRSRRAGEGGRGTRPLDCDRPAKPLCCVHRSPLCYPSERVREGTRSGLCGCGDALACL